MPAPLCAAITGMGKRGRATSFLISQFAGEAGFEFDKALLVPHLHIWPHLLAVPSTTIFLPLCSEEIIWSLR